MQALQHIENRIDALMQGNYPSEAHETKLNDIQWRLEDKVGEYVDWHTDAEYNDGLRYYHLYGGDFFDKEIIVDRDLVYKVSNTEDIRWRGNIIASTQGETQFWIHVSKLLDA
jgi:histone deacetylase complex regulatory component SIN3